MRHPEAQDDEMRGANAIGGDVLGMRDVRFATTSVESKALNDIAYPETLGYYERRAFFSWLRFQGRQSSFYSDPG